MNYPIHFVVSAALAAAYFFITGSYWGAAGLFAGGFMIDFDHMIDFLFYKRKLVLTPEFFSSNSRRIGKLYIFFHSYEIVAAVYAAALLSGSAMLIGVGIGMTVHLAMDVIGNPVHPQTFSLIYRMSKGFKAQEFFIK